MTSEEPSWEIPAGMYDVGDGFYDPRTKCVSDPATGEILRYDLQGGVRSISRGSGETQSG